MTFKIGKNSDPFKKYWWVLLLIFSALGLWVSYPSFQSGQTADGGAFGRSLMTVRQSLDSVDNPEGAPGSPIGAAGIAQGPYAKQSGVAEDGLFPHPKAPAPAASSGGASRTFADSLAILAGIHGRGSGAFVNAAVIPVAVDAPALGGGLGGGSGISDGGSGASYSGGGMGSGSSGLGAFSESQPKTNLENAGGLDGGGGSSSGGAMGALKSEAVNGAQAVNATTNDGASAGLAGGFDGSRGGSGLIGAANGQSDSGVGIGGSGIPMNLKPNPTTMGLKQVSPPMPTAPQTNASSGMMMQMMMMCLPMLMMGMMGM